ncbi:TPM domain-containing protein [Paenibacillus lutrae]|uniref:TPM domain-containing protein n=1 Tax=Paenibacillus lutrae TaxID=2078573 RepID=A0A7X3FL47_9BACL|nr:TPM domain-containing protein [Paenibacillus lutrae]MVP01617.1 TPM domain-containing protein [Paenibacillus lutrae]
MNTISRTGLALVLFLMMICTTVAAAPPAPERTGIVTDPAGLLTSSQARQVEQELQGRDYEVLLLTAKGLNEQEGEQLANTAYDQWGLSGNQLMLVVTTSPNYVHLVFDNEQLQTAVSKTKAKNAKGIVDLNFVPLAGQGRVAEGILAISNYVNDLPRVAGPGLGGAAVSSGISGATLTTIAVSVILLLAAVLLGMRYRRMARTRKHLEEAKRLYAEAQPVLNGLLFSDIFQELEKGFLQGETRKQAEELEAAVLAFQGESGSLEERLQAQRAAFFGKAAEEKSARKLAQDVGDYMSRLEPYRTRLTEFEKQSAQVRRSVEQAKEQFAAANSLVEAWAAKTSYPLSVMKMRVQEAQAELEKADELDEFDYLQAGSSAQTSLKQLEAIRISIDVLGKLEAEHPRYLPRVQSLEEELRSIAARERLLLTDGDPYAILQKTSNAVPQLAARLQEGDAEEAQRTAGRIEEGLSSARALVEEMIHNRDSALEAVRELEGLVQELTDFDRVYRNESDKLGADFAANHRHEQTERYNRLLQAQEEMVRLLSEVRSEVAADVQEYRRAAEQSGKALQLAAEIRQLRQLILGYYDSLNQRVRSVQSHLQQVQERFYQASSSFGQLGVNRTELAGMITDGIRSTEDLQRQMEGSGLDVDRLEEQLQRSAADSLRVAEQVQQLVQEKEEAVRHLRKFEEEYRSRHARYSRSISLSRYSSGYGTLAEESERLIAQGLFVEAMGQIAAGEQILAQMDRDYQRHVSAERARRNGPGGPGGGGRSSGSSGWGGQGGRSSGSSGWGGGRSGGGGRSSGSSKW